MKKEIPDTQRQAIRKAYILNQISQYQNQFTSDELKNVRISTNCMDVFIVGKVKSKMSELEKKLREIVSHDSQCTSNPETPDCLCVRDTISQLKSLFAE